MKKILLYTDTPLFGGAENHIYELAKHLDKLKYEVVMLCSKYKSLDEWAKKFEDIGIRVVRIPALHKHDPGQFFRLKKIFQAENPDLIHLHLWNPASCRFAYLAASKKQKIIATEHDPFQLLGFKETLKKNFLQRTDHIIAVSNSNKNLIGKIHPEVANKLTVIHNGIEADKFVQASKNLTESQKLEIKKNIFKANDDSVIIISVATLHPRKGLKYLIKATKIVSREFPNIKTCIVGTGPEKQELEDLIKSLDLFNEVVLLGYQSDIASLMAASNAVVLPSIKEAFGLVILEGMAAGLPVIASNVDGIPEIITDKKNGLLFESMNSNDLAEKIKEVIKNPELRANLIKNGNDTAKEFSAETMAKRTEEIYDRIINQ